MKLLIAPFLSVLLLLVFGPSVIAETKINYLPECIVVTHCAFETWEVSNVGESFDTVVEAVANTPRTKIVERNDSFIHAEAKTKWLRYTDDLLVQALPQKGIIQVRSESRVGIGDNGVNKRRIQELAYRLTTNQIK